MLHQTVFTEQFFEVDFDQEEGRLRFGPVHKSAAARIHQILQAFDLTTGADNRIRIIPVSAELARIEVYGQNVSGYFAEGDGLEASEETLDAFVLHACPKNYPVSLHGYYYPDDETRINTVMTAVHDGVSVRWSRLRNRLRDGTCLCISTPTELSVIG